MAEMSEEIIGMNKLVKFFLAEGINPERAIRIMGFTIMTLIKLKEPLNKWEVKKI